MAAEEPALTKQFDWAITRRILRYVFRYKAVALGAPALSLAIAASGQSFPVLQRRVIDHYLAPAAGSAGAALDAAARMDGILTVAWVYLAVAAVEFGARYGVQYALAWLSQHVLYDVRAELF